MAEKTFNLRLTEKEMKIPKVKDYVLKIIVLRLKGRKYDKFMKISSMEYEIIRKHYSWAGVEIYKPIKKERYKNEIGKYQGKRCVLIGK